MDPNLIGALSDLPSAIFSGAKEIRAGLDRVAAAIEELAESQRPQTLGVPSQPTTEKPMFTAPPREERPARSGPPGDAGRPGHEPANEDVTEEYLRGDERERDRSDKDG